jgi:hypothetical protein
MKVKKLRFHFVGLGYAVFYWVMLGLVRYDFVELATFVINLFCLLAWGKI